MVLGSVVFSSSVVEDKLEDSVELSDEGISVDVVDDEKEVEVVRSTA